MKVFKTVLFFTLILIGFANGLFAQEIYVVKKYEVIISGTSNLHDWTAKVSDIQGNAECNSNILSNVIIAAQANKIVSSKGNIMDRKIRNALNVDKFSSIIYRSIALKAKSEVNGTTQITADGSITISGVTKPITTTTNCKLLQNGSVEAVGSFDVFMTDFGIQPPTALWGALTTANKVSIIYKIVFGKKG